MVERYWAEAARGVASRHNVPVAFVLLAIAGGSAAAAEAAIAGMLRRFDVAAGTARSGADLILRRFPSLRPRLRKIKTADCS